MLRVDSRHQIYWEESGNPRGVPVLFLHGGPSQFETFDPKMGAPLGVRSVTGEIKTAIPGVTFGSTFEKLAKLNDKFSIVRSFFTGDGNHDIKPVVGVDLGNDRKLAARFPLHGVALKKCP